jgi:hypothetical protein
MRALIPALIFLLTVSGCDDPNSAANLKAHGVISIYRGAPFCMIYVGLNPDEFASFNSAFWHFADQHDIRKPRKHYTAYSGPPRAAAMSAHVAFYVDYWPTPDVVARHNVFGPSSSKEPMSWENAMIGFNAYMPTNACLINKDGQEILAPYTGSIGIAPYDTNYPAQDFKQLAVELTAAIQSAFPDRAVRSVSYYGGKQ